MLGVLHRKSLKHLRLHCEQNPIPFADLVIKFDALAPTLRRKYSR